MNACEDFGEQLLKDARAKEGYKLEEVARLVGVSETKMRKYERDFGSTPAHIATKLLGIYRVPIRALRFAWTRRSVEAQNKTEPR